MDRIEGTGARGSTTLLITCILQMALIPAAVSGGQAPSTRPSDTPAYQVILPGEEVGRGPFGRRALPVAVASSKTGRTFVVFPAPAGEGNAVALMVGAIDHQQPQAMRPVRLPGKHAGTDTSACLLIDAKERLWVFASDGAGGRSRIFRSDTPKSFDGFVEQDAPGFTSPQCWAISSGGFVMLHGSGKKDAHLAVRTTGDGAAWSEPLQLAAVGDGQHWVSGSSGAKVGVAFTADILKEGKRIFANLYYIESSDAGRTWTSAGRERLELPLGELAGQALVYNYLETPFQIDIKDLSFDRTGSPTILYLASPVRPRPGVPFRVYWNTARWAGRKWEVTGFLSSDSRGDSGCIFAEPPNIWRMLATTLPGAAPGWPGGEVVSYLSDDYGRSWGRQALTSHSRSNHGGLTRPLNAVPEVYALWTDSGEKSGAASRIYFSTRDGTVYRLPATMAGDVAPAEEVLPGAGQATQSAPGTSTGPTTRTTN